MDSATNPSSDHPDPSIDPREHDLIPMLEYPRDLHFLSAALRGHGAAYIINPPLPPPPFSTATESLFSLPMPKKAALRHQKSTVRGYAAHLAHGREWWDYTPETNVEDRLAPKDEKFNSETEAYFKAGVALLAECVDVLRTEYPSIPAEASDQGTSTIRYLHYSLDLIDSSKEHSPTPLVKEQSSTTPGKEQSPTTPKIARMLAHTDHGSLTLMTATAITAPSGLHIYSPAGKPYAAPHIDDTVLIIAGDSLAHWTVGEKRILPTPHEVLLGPAGSPEEELVSLAVFLRPGPDVMLSDGYDGYRMNYGQWAAGKGKVPGRRCWLVGRDVPQPASQS